MTSYEKLLKTIFEKEKNVALIISKILKEEYVFFDLLMEFLEQIKLQPSRLTLIQEVLGKYDVLLFVEKTINQIEFTSQNGQYIMTIRNKYFSSLSNFKKFLDFINILLRNNVSFYAKIFAGSTTNNKDISIFKFIILAHLQSSLRPVYHNTLVAVNTLFYALGDECLNKSDQKARVGELFIDIIEQYDFMFDLNFFKLVEVLIINNEIFLLKMFNNRLNLLNMLADTVLKIKNRKRQLLSLKILQHLLMLNEFSLDEVKSARFYDQALMNLHRNSTNLISVHLQPILLNLPHLKNRTLANSKDFENFVTENSDLMESKSAVSS